MPKHKYEHRNYFVIPVEVPPHIEAFYNTQCFGRIKVGRRSIIGSLVLARLRPMPFGERPARRKKGRHYVDLVITNRYTRRRHYLSPDAAAELRAMLREEYDYTFQRDVERLMRRYDLNKTEAIELFRKKYGITEQDLAFDSSRKAFYRYEKSEKIL